MTASNTQQHAAVNSARAIRNCLYKALTPVDYLVRLCTGMQQYPPAHLRRHVGTPFLGFAKHGREFARHLQQLTGLQPDHSIWDLGCGCGLLELALEECGWHGPVIGTDIHRPSIEWASRHITSRSPTFSFLHSDIANKAYWPDGRLSAADWLKTFTKADFDIILAKSFFTHILSDELDVYLSAISKRLRPGGKALLTFFLLNKEQQDLAGSGKSHISFHRAAKGETHALRRLNAPSAAVAYDEQHIRAQIAACGMPADKLVFHYGSWAGRDNTLSFQDIVIATK